MTTSSFDGNLVELTATSGTYSVGKSANYRIRELVSEASKHDSNISLVYKDTLRSMLDLFGKFYIVDYEGKLRHINSIHANPERPVAKMVQEDNLVLPIISVAQPRTSISPERRKYFPLVVIDTIWDEIKQRAFRVVGLAPKPIDIEYRISVWSKYKNDLDQITEQIHSTFNPGFELQTSISNNTKAFLDDETDDTVVQVGDREDRLLKRSFTVKVETYVPSPKFLFSATGKLERFNLEGNIVDDISEQ
jgi:hypothetical protein